MLLDGISLDQNKLETTKIADDLVKESDFKILDEDKIEK
jgi:hypothetical protein